MQKPPDCLWRAQLWRADHHQRLYQIVLALCFESLYKRFRHESAVGMSDDTHLPRLRVCRERFDFRNKVYNTALCRNAIFKNLFGRKAPIVGKGAARRDRWGVIDVLEEDRARKERVHEHIGVVGKYVAHVLVGKGKDDLLAGVGVVKKDGFGQLRKNNLIPP